MGCCSPAPRSLVIESTVLRINGETCERCGKTVEAVRTAVKELQTVLTPLNVRVTLIEHAGAEDDVEGSNSVMINGRPIEQYIGAERVSTDCPSCGDLLGKSTCCPATSVGGTVQESFSVEQVREAAFAALELAGTGGGGCC